jgi:DNA-binding SARP family transcriptional activator
VGQLMLASYRAAAHEDPLDAYRRARHLLAGELGLEPGEPLVALERRMLERDPSEQAARQLDPGSSDDPPTRLSAAR